MATKKNKELSAEEQAALSNQEDKQYKFITTAFNHKGVEYKSAQLEKLIEEGDEAALALVPELIALGQIVEVENETQEG